MLPAHVKETFDRVIQTSKSIDELVSRLRKGIEILVKPKYDEKEQTLLSAIQSFLKEPPAKAQVKLTQKELVELSDVFFLTPGLHVVAAPSGHGKTFWAMKWAEAAARSGSNVLFVSLEMTANDLAARKITEHVEIPLLNVVTRQFPGEMKQALLSLTEQKEQEYLKNIYILNLGDYDWVKIKSRLEQAIHRIQPQLIIIDYVQMMYSSDLTSERQSQVYAEIARDVKLFGDNNHCACLLLSQINREGSKDIQKADWAKIGHVPLINDHVKESGGIVEAADSVQLICIPSKFSASQAEFLNTFQVSVSKSRRLGVLKTVLFPFDSEKMRFL